MKGHLTDRAQIILIWWALITMWIFGFALWVLMRMVPPPSPNLPASVIVEFYRTNAVRIRIGAMITSWTSAFMVPLAIVISAQMLRFEKGIPLLAIAQVIGGATMSMFLVFPPMIYGIAAFTPDRAPDVTAMLHEMGSLVLVTTDQYYMFQLFAIIYLCFSMPPDKLSPFPRWLGWLSLCAGIIYEVGPLGFIFKRGPFAWDGMIVFWLPFVTFGIWITVLSVLLLAKIKLQRASSLIATDPAASISR
jgi:hypothetical protein